MVVLDKALFTGQEGICEEEIVKAEVTNWRESTDATLRSFSGLAGRQLAWAWSSHRITGKSRKGSW